MLIACSDGDRGADGGQAGSADGPTGTADGTTAAADGTPGPADGATGDGGTRPDAVDDGTRPTDGAGPQDGGDAGGPQDAGPVDLAPDTKCVPQSSILATVGPSGGSKCSFAFAKPFTPGEINLLLTPGWGIVCHAGSSSNCGSGASADGWWFSGGEIHLCDATCARFYEQTAAGKLTVRLGCPTEDCTH